MEYLEYFSFDTKDYGVDEKQFFKDGNIVYQDESTWDTDYANASVELKAEFDTWISHRLIHNSEYYRRKISCFESKEALPSLSKISSDIIGRCRNAFDGHMDGNPFMSVEHLFKKFIAAKKRMNAIAYCKKTFELINANEIAKEVASRESRTEKN